MRTVFLPAVSFVCVLNLNAQQHLHSVTELVRYAVKNQIIDI